MIFTLRASLDDDERLIAERLAQLVREHGGASEAARKTNIPLRSLSKYIAGDATPSASTVARIARSLGRSSDWLLGIDDRAVAAEDKPDQANYYPVPVLSVHASAGSGHQNDDSEVTGHWAFALDYLHRLGVAPKKARIVMARGDSMLPTILDGAPVLIDTSQRDLIDGRIFALRGPDGLRIKRVQRALDGSVLLISDNKDLYGPERVSSPDIQHLKIIGRVFWTEKAI